jgi:hypothetical protein
MAAGDEVVVDFSDAGNGRPIGPGVHIHREEHHTDENDGAVQVAGCEDSL